MQNEIVGFGLHEAIGYESEYNSNYCESRYDFKIGITEVQGKIAAFEFFFLQFWKILWKYFFQTSASNLTSTIFHISIFLTSFILSIRYKFHSTIDFMN